MEEDGYGWLFLNATGDVDCYTLSSNTGVYWHTPSSEAGQKAADHGALPSPGPDGVAGTADDGFGDGTPDPRGSSILYLPTWLHWEYHGGTDWAYLFSRPWPQVMTTGTAYNIVDEPTSLIDDVYNMSTGEPWEFLAGIQHPPAVNHGHPKWNAYVTYACVWSILEIDTVFGALDMLYIVEEKMVRDDVLIADINCDEVCNIVDIVIAANAYDTEDEGGPGPDGEYYTDDDRYEADPNFDARGDVADDRGVVNIVDIARISLDFDEKLQP